jgi:O-antigen/teichoic acid export membrane protein
LSTFSIRSILVNKNLQNTGVIAFGTLFGSFFSYLLQFFLGRLLTVSDYGTFNAFLSLSYLLGIPATVLGVSIVKRVAEYTAKEDNATTTSMFKSLSLVSILGGFLLSLFLIAFSPNISERLNIGSRDLVVLFSLFMGLSFLSVISISFIQGLMLYRRWAFFSTLSGFLRMLFAILPVILGLGIGAIFVGLSINVIVMYLISIFLLWKVFTKGKGQELLPEYKKLLLFGTSTLFLSIGLTFMNNIDMVLVKKYFDPITAGYYAGAITVGKILLFGCTAVATLMFPSISALYARKKDFLPQLKQLLLIQSVLVGLGLLIFELFPYLITKLFFGSAFSHSVPYLRVFCLFIACYVFIYFLVMFSLSIEKTKVYFFLIPGILIQYFMIRAYHNSIFQVIYSDIASALFTLLILVCYLFFVLRKKASD